jgi:hypothetical protein
VGKKGAEEVVLEALDTWKYAFLNCKDMQSFCRRVQDIVILCGKEFLNSDVERTLRNLDKPTDRTGELYRLFSFTKSYKNDCQLL